MKRLLFHAVLLVIALCIALIFTSSGVLIYSGAAKDDAARSRAAVQCIYFTGTGIVRRTAAATPSDGSAKPACKRVIELGD